MFVNGILCIELHQRDKSTRLVNDLHTKSRCSARLGPGVRDKRISNFSERQSEIMQFPSRRTRTSLESVQKVTIKRKVRFWMM